jgi:tetratricopeptide (TPR) repeat protein
MAGCGAVLVAMAAALGACARDASCIELARAGAYEALAMCETEDAHAPTPAVTVTLAGLRLRAGAVDDAAAAATSLLTTPEAGAALRVLAQVSAAHGRWNDAFVLLHSAIARHGEDPYQRSRDHHVLATTLLSTYRYSAALAAIDDAIAWARRSGDRRAEALSRLALADVLTIMGDTAAAHAELDAAEHDLGPIDVPWFHLKRGMLDMALQRWHMAAVDFEKAIAGDSPPSVVLAARLGLASVLVAMGRLAEAEHNLDIAAAMGGEQRMNQDYHRGRIAAARGHDTEAADRLERAYALAPSHEWAMAIALKRSHAASGPPVEEWLRRAADRSEHARDAEPLVELRPWILASRRDPFDELFLHLARAGHDRDAIDVWRRSQARALWDVVAYRYGGTGGRGDQRARADWATAAAVPAAPRSSLAAQLRDHDVLAVIAAGDEIWRATFLRDRLELQRVGPRDEITTLSAAAFRGDARALADLGARIVPLGIAASPKPLHVVVDPALGIGALPIAALTRGGRPLIADRALVFAPNLSTVGCAAAAPPGRGVLVIGAPSTDLPDSLREATWVAGLLRGHLAVGAAARRDAVLSAGTLALLHVATHADVSASVASLRLVDGPLRATEIATATAPERVVLSACTSALAPDADGLGALASAFLLAGSRQVVGTVRAVGDRTAADLMRAFYEQDGAARPVNALAAAQRVAASRGDSGWASFVVVGEPDDCSPVAPR